MVLVHFNRDGLVVRHHQRNFQLDSPEKELSMTDRLEFLTDSHKFLMQKTAEYNQNNEQRFEKMDDSLQQILKALEDMEQRSYNPRPSTPPSQVPVHFSESNRSSQSLVYRSGELNLAGRDSMLKKIEMPCCDGSNTTDWLVDIEHFFDIGRFREEEKLDLITLCNKGKVKKWFAWFRRLGGFRSWIDFC